MEESISAFDAKTHLSSLLRETENGKSFVIRRRGRPVAKLVPVAGAETDWAGLLKGFRELRKRLGPPMDIRSLIEEGRRY